MKRNASFRCGTCNLVEERITEQEVLQLSAEHNKGNHIDVFELRKNKHSLTR